MNLAALRGQVEPGVTSRAASAGVAMLLVLLIVMTSTQHWDLLPAESAEPVVEIEARLQYADGSGKVWRRPQDEAMFGAYRTYRWRPWADDVADDRRTHLWAAATLWLASEYTRNGQRPTQIDLVRRVRPPGQRVWQETVIYVARFRATD